MKFKDLSSHCLVSGTYSFSVLNTATASVLEHVGSFKGYFIYLWRNTRDDLLFNFLYKTKLEGEKM